MPVKGLRELADVQRSNRQLLERVTKRFVGRAAMITLRLWRLATDDRKWVRVCQTYMPIHTYARTRARTHAHMHARTRTHACTYTHTGAARDRAQHLEIFDARGGHAI